MANKMNKYNEHSVQFASSLTIADLEKDFEINDKKINSISEKLENSKLNPFEDIPEENPVILINGVGAATLGNILTITGKAKSKKSMFLAIWTATLLGETNIKGFVSGLGAVKGIYFDTEQSKRHAHLQYTRIFTLLGTNKSKGLSYYVLRPYSPLERLEMIKEAIYKTPDLTFVLIDGIADLLSKGVNDEEEAINLTNLLMKWSLERNIHIATVLHQNKANSDAKGHIGSYLMQKSETVLSIEKDTNDKEVSIVSSPYSRGMEIDEIYFSVDENGIPFIMEDFKTAGTEKAKSKNPFEYEREVHHSILSKVFNKTMELKYNDLKEKIKYVLGTYSISIGDSKTREWITYYKEQEMISQDAQMKPYKLGKSVW